MASIKPVLDIREGFHGPVVKTNSTGQAELLVELNDGRRSVPALVRRQDLGSDCIFLEESPLGSTS